MSDCCVIIPWKQVLFLQFRTKDIGSASHCQPAFLISADPDDLMQNWQALIAVPFLKIVFNNTSAISLSVTNHNSFVSSQRIPSPTLSH